MFFPQSPINILSVTEFAKQLEDEEGTGIDTKQLRSRFCWDRNKFSLTIRHPESNLPEMPINEGCGISHIYSTLVSKVVNTATNFRYSCCFTKLPDLNDCSDCKNISSEDNLSSATTDDVQELFEVGETLFCVKDGWSGLVKVKSIYIDDTDVLWFVVTDSNQEDIITT